MGGSLPWERDEVVTVHPWYAVRVRTRQEKLIASLLEHRSYKTFVPLRRGRRRWSDRMKEIEQALFPGYVFCRFDINRRLPVLTTPGVLEVVGSGSAFIPVDEIEILNLQAVVASQICADPWPYQYIGQRVRVECGPLQGVEGFLQTVKTADRLILSVSLLQRSVAVEIDQRWVRPLEERSVFACA